MRIDATKLEKEIADSMKDVRGHCQDSAFCIAEIEDIRGYKVQVQVKVTKYEGDFMDDVIDCTLKEEVEPSSGRRNDSGRG